MHNQKLFKRYIELCVRSMETNTRVQSALRNKGMIDAGIFERFSIGYADGSVVDLVSEDKNLVERFERTGITERGTEVLKRRLTIPISDSEGGFVNIIGYSPWPQTKQQILSLNPNGIWNETRLHHAKEILLVDDPVRAFELLQKGIENTTFLFGDDGKYVTFCVDHGISSALFLCEGHARLAQDLSGSGVTVGREDYDIDSLIKKHASETRNVAEPDDDVTEIEHGFLFRFPLLQYRVLGNFSEHAMHMRVNIKAFNNSDAFVDAIDLVKHRSRQTFIYNLMERFSLRDQVQLEKDLNRMVEVIEEYKERNARNTERSKPELTDRQRDVGMQLLKNPHLINEIADDFDELGYVQERKNKVLLYLVMTSRLMENPLHAIIISRSGAGKSKLAEVTADLCPPEDAESVSDLSSNALYYFGENDLKHKFIVIGEKTGSDSSEYPLRELISRKSITKAIPMKDQGTGQIRTITITVNGPISLVETTTSSNVNPENLNRCFVMGIDESEAQTKLIHDLQRRNFTTGGFLRKRSLDEIREKHRCAQRLLQPVRVFNPYAEHLTFPSGTLRSRRDNEKFLRLISVICFLHQHQRERKILKVSNSERIEYIECTINDYRIAHELLSDGVLDSTLDDLPQSARKLIDTIRNYVVKRAEEEAIPPEKVIFERKDIREFSSWSFAQVRNNIKILREYEYISCIKSQNGLANRYRINAGYGDLDYMGAILSPETLVDLIHNTEDPNMVNVPK